MCEYVYYKDKDVMYSMIYPIGDYIVLVQTVISNMAKEIYRILMEKYDIHSYGGRSKTIVLACRGSSGTILSSGVATKLYHFGVPNDIVIYVSRKMGEYSHGRQRPLEEYIGGYIIIVIDDFVETGNTIRSIIKDLEDPKNNVLCSQGTLDILCTTDARSLNGKYNKPEYDNSGIDLYFKYRICCLSKYLVVSV